MDFISNPELLLQALGPWVIPGVAFIIFIESGCLFPFLPGDSLIFTAALLHAEFGFSPWTLVIVCVIAAFLGVQVGYWLGAKFGRKLFKDDARVLKTEYLVRAEEFFDKWGALSLVLSRFVPIVRTFVPIAAGAARMNYKRFVIFNTIAAVLWVGLMTILGLTLGRFDFVRERIDVIAVLIILISVMPMVIAWLNNRRKARKEAKED
ncbi:MAG: VTT domain-containing protein [Actinomycetaceae bacterium]|nr:VTT domain-containing protein [Actinomycetaceae bacterium]